MRHFITKAALKTFLTTILIIFVGCNKNKKNTDSGKKVLLIATQNFNEIKRTFKIFADSSYTFVEISKETNHVKNETFKGFVKICKDSIKFHPFKLDYNEAETAILKNGFIEFTDGEYSDRMQIIKTTLPVKNNLDLKKFPNYAIFTFYKNFNKEKWKKDYTNYDLNNQELLKIDHFFKNEFAKNKKLRNFNDYLKQVVAVRNSRNEIIIQAHFFCNDFHLSESFQYYETSMMDGGVCNIYLGLNLTTGKFNFINIAGMG